MIAITNHNSYNLTLWEALTLLHKDSSKVACIEHRENEYLRYVGHEFKWFNHEDQQIGVLNFGTDFDKICYMTWSVEVRL